jgi:predicted nuclease of predicted toxin-antitoxin system
MANSYANPTSLVRVAHMAKLLIDECQHTSLVELAQMAGHVADHVNYMGLSGSKDWELMSVVREKEYTLVTNNRSDFLALYGREGIHAGLIVIVPSVRPAQQRELFRAVHRRTRSNEYGNRGRFSRRGYRMPRVPSPAWLTRA